MDTLARPRERLLLSELHHRTANAFQIVSAMLSRTIRELDHPAAVQALRKADAQLRAFALLNEMLRVSEFPGAGDEAICAAAYLKRLCAELQSACPRTQGIGLTVAAPEPQLLSEKVCRHLGLIAAELVLNAAKHAFVGRTEGEVRVVLTRDAQCPRLRLIVCDDGIGMHPGFDADPHRGLGLVRLLSESIGAECTGFTGPGGTAITLTVPLQAAKTQASPEDRPDLERPHDQ